MKKKIICSYAILGRPISRFQKEKMGEKTSKKLFMDKNRYQIQLIGFTCSFSRKNVILSQVLVLKNSPLETAKRKTLKKLQFIHRNRSNNGPCLRRLFLYQSSSYLGQQLYLSCLFLCRFPEMSVFLQKMKILVNKLRKVKRDLLCHHLLLNLDFRKLNTSKPDFFEKIFLLPQKCLKKENLVSYSCNFTERMIDSKTVSNNQHCK